MSNLCVGCLFDRVKDVIFLFVEKASVDSYLKKKYFVKNHVSRFKIGFLQLTVLTMNRYSDLFFGIRRK